VTFLHYAEHIVDIPGKRITRYKVPIEENGARVWREMEEVDTNLAHANWPDHFLRRSPTAILPVPEMRARGLATPRATSSPRANCWISRCR
jgi:hypothetical protein